MNLDLAGLTFTPKRATVALVAGVAVCLLLGYWLRAVLTPFFFAFLVAYLLNPLVGRLESKGLPRTAAIGALIGVTGLVILVAGAVLVPVVKLQVENLNKQMPLYVEQARQWAVPLVKRFGGDDPQRIRALLDGLVQKLGSIPFQILQHTTAIIWKTLAGVMGLIVFLLQVLVVPVAAFYLLRDFEKLDDHLISWVPVPYRESFRKRLSEIDAILSSFLRGQLTVCAALALIYSVGLTLSGTPMSVVIGVGAGLANLVPYLGLAVGLLPALVLTALAHASWGHIIGVVATFAVAQALEGYLITPRVVGERVGLHPVVIMAALLVGGSLFGFFGLLFAVPAACVLKVLLAALKESYQGSEYFGDEPSGGEAQ